MSNTITAYFKGRVGVAESVYQNDYGMVMNFDSIELPANFDCYFSILNQEEAIPGVGADGMVAIPNSVLANPGAVTIHIPIHTGANDSEVEYVVYFKVIGRARPIDDGTPAQMTAIEQALALLQNPITNIEQIVNEALSFTGDTFDEMQQELQDDFDNYTETLEGDLATWKGGVESDIDDVEHDFTVLQNQFDTAVAAVSTDTELTDIRVGDDEVTYTTAGLAVRSQFSKVKSDLSFSEIGNAFNGALYNGYWSAQGVLSADGSDVCCLNKIPCDENAKVVIKATTSVAGLIYYISYFDEAGTTRIKRDTGNGTEYSGVAPSGASYVTFVFEKAGLLPTNFDGIKVYINNAVHLLKEDVATLVTDMDAVVEEVAGMNLFDGNFDESGYFDASGNKASSNFKRTSKYYPIYGTSNGYLYGYLSATTDTFVVYFYDSAKAYVDGGFINNANTGIIAIPASAKYFRVYTRASFSGNVTLALESVSSYIPYELIPAVKNNIIGEKNLTASLQTRIGYYEPPIFVNGIKRGALIGLYMVDSTYTPYGVSITESDYRLKLKDGNGNIRVNGENVSPQYYSDKIQRFVDPTTGAIVAYYVLHYDGTNYALDSNSLTLASSATSLEDNYLISEYLNREENLVLIGDSIFGYQSKNVLEAVLATMSDKQVFNCAFGGCQMAWRTADGSNAYDPFSFVSVADAIVADDFSSQLSGMELNQGYPYRVASLRSIDWTKPTTILINYVNNDITGNIPIGDVWDYTDTSFNKQSVLGAFNYGLKELLETYPHIRVIELTSAWRKMGNDNLPPYAYTNTLGKSPIDYDNAIKENAERQGIAVYDYFKYGGRNWYNAGYYQVDNSHFNEKGFNLLAKVLDAVDRSFIE